MAKFFQSFASRILPILIGGSVRAVAPHARPIFTSAAATLASRVSAPTSKVPFGSRGISETSSFLDSATRQAVFNHPPDEPIYALEPLPTTILYLSIANVNKTLGDITCMIAENSYKFDPNVAATIAICKHTNRKDINGIAAAIANESNKISPGKRKAFEKISKEDQLSEDVNTIFYQKILNNESIETITTYLKNNPNTDPQANAVDAVLRIAYRIQDLPLVAKAIIDNIPGLKPHKKEIFTRIAEHAISYTKTGDLLNTREKPTTHGRSS